MYSSASIYGSPVPSPRTPRRNLHGHRSQDNKTPRSAHVQYARVNRVLNWEQDARSLNQLNSASPSASAILSSPGNTKSPIYQSHGNLADELSAAWAESDEGEDRCTPIHYESSTSSTSTSVIANRERCHTSVPNSTAGTVSPASSPRSLSLLKEQSPLSSRSFVDRMTRKHARRRRPSSPALNSATVTVSSTDDISPRIDALISEVEYLTNEAQAMVSSDSAQVSILALVRNLPNQASLETLTAEYIKTNEALAMNIAQQSRAIISTSMIFQGGHTLGSGPLTGHPHVAEVERIEPPPTSAPFAFISASTSKPSTRPEKTLAEQKISTQLHRLTSSTATLLRTFSTISDNLQIERDVATAAARQLQISRHLVAQMKLEAERSEQGIRRIEDNRCAEKLKARECARTCTELIRGFEEVCHAWKEAMITNDDSQGLMKTDTDHCGIEVAL